MFLFRFLVRPSKHNKEYEKVSGAYANCWVNIKGQRQAEEKIRQYLAEGRWRVEAIDKVLITRMKDNRGDPESLRYYREAKEEGLCVVLYKWPRKTSRRKSNKGVRQRKRHSSRKT